MERTEKIRERGEYWRRWARPHGKGERDVKWARPHKLVESDRVSPVSRVGSGSTLWVGVSTQTRPDLSGRVDPDPIGHGLGWVRVVFFFVSCLVQPI